MFDTSRSAAPRRVAVRYNGELHNEGSPRLIGIEGLGSVYTEAKRGRKQNGPWIGDHLAIAFPRASPIRAPVWPRYRSLGHGVEKSGRYEPQIPRVVKSVVRT